MNTEAVAFILIILVISASVFITVSNMNKTVQDLNNTVSSISAELNTIKQAINMTEDYRVLLALLGPLALEKLEKTIVLEDYIIHVVQGVGAGDILAPHLWDWFLDGINDYIVVGLQPDGSGNPFVIYGWSEITIIDYVNYIYPKPNTYWSKTNSFGLEAGVNPATYIIANNRTDYTSLYLNFVVVTETSTTKNYAINVLQYRNSWILLTRRLTSSRTLTIFINNSNVLNTNIPASERTILEWDPETASTPARYKRYTIGSNTALAENLPQYQAFLIIYSRALADAEIQNIYNAKIVNASALEIFIDPTFNLNNLGRHNATVNMYNGVNIVKANETWIWILKNATADAGVWLRFFPSGTIIVYRTGEIEKIISTEYYTNRTDIMLIMIPKEAIG